MTSDYTQYRHLDYTYPYELEACLEEERKTINPYAIKPPLDRKADSNRGIWLPVNSSAFYNGVIMPTWPHEVIRMRTGYTTVRAFYEHCGILIKTPHPNRYLDGWYYCQLPPTWKIIECSDTDFYGDTYYGDIYIDESHKPRFFLSHHRPFVHTIIVNNQCLATLIDHQFD